MCDCEHADHPPTPPIPPRRRALIWMGTGITAVGAALAALPVLGFLLAPARLRARDEWVDLGPVSTFPAGTTRLATYRNPVRRPWDGQTDTIPCWVRHIEGHRFQVFAINCTHLGCPVRWFEGSRLFMCPCHGGVYYEDGSRASGPPPRGLYEYEHRVVDDHLHIHAGRLPTLQESA